jgi:GGDEF domain-containing protein
MTSITAPTETLEAPADNRRLNLLRMIAEAGGKVSPIATASAEHGYEYLPPFDDENELNFLARRDYLEERFLDRVTVCPKCASHHLNVREICPGCRRARLASEGLLHHFRCGFVGRLSEFTTVDDGNGSRLCPKCNRRLHHLGTEYDRLGKASVCLECGVITENPPVEAVCFACGTRSSAEDLVSVDVFSYVLTSLGVTAIRRGSMLDRDNEVLFIEGMPVYRRSVILEFIDHEMKRLRQLKSEFSLLVAEFARQAPSNDGVTLLLPCLTRIRQCLREVDLIGQLTDAVYVVILPQTARKAAEALRKRILSELAPRPPALLAVQITEPIHLEQVLSRRSAVGGP